MFSVICATIFICPTLLWAIPVQTEELRLPKPGEMVLKSEKDIPNHIWVAGQYLKSGRFNDVISICEQVLSMKENYVEARAHLAAAYKGLKKEAEFRRQRIYFYSVLWYISLTRNRMPGVFANVGYRLKAYDLSIQKKVTH